MAQGIFDHQDSCKRCNHDLEHRTTQHTIRCRSKLRPALLCSGVAVASARWVDEVWNMVMFEKASYPGSNFDPYLQKLDRIRTGLDREDQSIVKMETARFLKMLLDRKHGINDVAADEIYNFVLSIRPAESSDSTLELAH